MPALQKKDMGMEKFEAMCDWIMNPPFAAEKSLMCSVMCASLGIDRRDADEFLYKELGLSCEAAIEAFRKGI